MTINAVYGVMALLFPVGIYCLTLAAINRRSSPLVVSGFWDSAGLLFATSGFFLVTVPLLLTDFYRRAIATATQTFTDIWLRYLLLWVIYYLFILAGGAFLVVWRTNKTMIYNVDAGLFQQLLDSMFAPMGLAVLRQARRLRITPVPPAPPETIETAIREGLPGPAAPTPADRRYAEVEIEPFPALCHVTLHWWHCTPELRRDIETELQKHLENAAPDDNPSASWFLGISGLIFGMMVTVLLTILLLVFFR